MKKNKYYISDIVSEEPLFLKVLFIFESPYKQELAKGHPVAGASGKSISKFLNSIDGSIPASTPFGEYMHHSIDHRFGICNCVNYPMDIAAYDDNSNLKYSPINLDIIRKKLTANSNIKGEVLKTFTQSLEDLKERVLRYIQTDQTIIVLCGKVAKNYFTALNLPIANRVIPVPHPSRNQWSYPNYKNTMNELKQSIALNIRG